EKEKLKRGIAKKELIKNDAINNKLEENKNGTRKDKKNDDINKEMDKKEPCEIDVEMPEPSEEGKGISENEDIDEDKIDDSWDSDNETVVGDDKKCIEVKNVYNKIWKEKVIALVDKKKKENFQSLDKTCKAWLEKFHAFNKESRHLTIKFNEIRRTPYLNWPS
ncbi:35903_t:CDS:2, partial [Gigaspora margarita]